MDLIKQYLNQSLIAASNNLRLTTHQLEALGLLRECILNSSDLQRDISKMKTITALSTLGIRLNEVYNFLSKEKIDFFKISEKFKQHSQYLINDLNQLLEIDNPEIIRESIKKITNSKDSKSELNNLGRNNRNDDNGNNGVHREMTSKREGIFSDYENAILKPIKSIDSMLKKMVNNEIDAEELSGYARLMKIHGEISEKNGFEILSKMHNILHKTFLLIKTRELMPGKEIIESIRACLIVIVAVVKGKDVDISGYLAKAENFEKEINTSKIKV